MIPNEVADAFSKIGVPVLVALITTLVVEYFAKPRLEARKSRLIRDRQQIDEVIFAFQKTAMLAAALLPDEYISHHPNTTAVQRRQIERLAPAVDGLFDATARLPSQFIARHSWHVGAASFFVAYFAGLVWSELESEQPDGDRLRAAGSDISEFDAYFAAHASFHDSQERWIKRAFSRRFLRVNYKEQAEAVIAKHGLELPKDRSLQAEG